MLMDLTLEVISESYVADFPRATIFSEPYESFRPQLGSSLIRLAFLSFDK